MNTLLKERNTKIRDELVDINHQIDLLKTKITGQSKYIKDLQSLNQDQIDKKRDSIKVHKGTIKEAFEESRELGKNLETLLKDQQKKQNENLKQTSQLNSLDLNYNQKIKDLVEQARFYEENDHCPTCDQDVGPELKEKKIQIIQNTAKGVQQEKASLEKELKTLKKELQDISNKLNTLQQKQQKINSNNEKISVIQKEIDKIQKEINLLNSQTGDTGTAKKELKEFRTSKEEITEKKLEYVEERTYNEVIGEMLKDTGIKTKVIKQYLPVMNRLINQYLQILDFFVAFHLDENFNETIRSRHRDSFNYASFSEGEKQRIDLSLLFTWRQIAKLKNSAATNLLILDETFDSSLDHDGVDSLTKILDTLDSDSNTFIISHKGDVLENKFRSKIEFFKSKNFSKIR
jgi:DNA repair exonuclease SbcCD ATPase subunit